MALQGPWVFFGCEISASLANSSKTKTLTQMLMKCNLYIQLCLKLTSQSALSLKHERSPVKAVCIGAPAGLGPPATPRPLTGHHQAPGSPQVS